jgi:hypothetical protein
MMLQEVMSSYFSNINENSNLIPTLNNDIQKPILPKSTSWSIKDKLLFKEYKFESRKLKEAFIVEMLKYIRESDCDIQITFRENKVKVIIHALSPSISSLEIECQNDVKKIKKDVSYYFAKKE